MAFVAVRNLTFTYPNQTIPALLDVSFTIREGEFTVLLGTTGSGKTTLLRLLKPEISPFGEMHGDIIYQDQPLLKTKAAVTAAEIGYVMQKPEAQIVTDKVWHELAFGLENIGMPPDLIERRIAEMATFFGITSWYHRDTARLSGGEMQLLNLAAVMAMQPKLLLLDEPTSQLDPIAATEFIRTLLKLNQEFGLTVLLCEHRLEEVFPLADRVIALDQGKVIADGTPKEVAEILFRSSLNQALPAAARIYYGLYHDGSSPLTVREGKAFIKEHFPKTQSLLPGKNSPSSDEVAIKATDLSFRYRKQDEDILCETTLTVSKGEIFSIAGANGSGKTTLLKVLGGILKPYQGKIMIFGKPIRDYGGDLYFETLNLLPQNPQDVFLRDTVIADFEEIAEHHYSSHEEFVKELETIDSYLSVSPLYQRHPYDLSGGEQQKAALAKILLLKPKILFLDEPTKGLDVILKQQLKTMIRILHEMKITILMVTHDIEFAAAVSTRCAILFDGRIVSESEPHAFFSGNSFYTTAAHRIVREVFPNAITVEESVELAKGVNGVKGVEKCEKSSV